MKIEEARQRIESAMTQYGAHAGAAIDLVIRKEQPILKAARAPGFTVEKLKAAWIEADQIK